MRVLLKYLYILCLDGFDSFRSRFPKLCESSPERQENMKKKLMGNHLITSISNPCLSTTSDGPTQILPFLYLGSQQDAMDSNLLMVLFIIFSIFFFSTPNYCCTQWEEM